MTESFNILMDVFKTHPIVAFVSSVTIYAAGETTIDNLQIPFIYMQIIQILFWVCASAAALVPVIDRVKKGIIPWIKSKRSKKK